MSNQLIVLTFFVSLCGLALCWEPFCKPVYVESVVPEKYVPPHCHIEGKIIESWCSGMCASGVGCDTDSDEGENGTPKLVSACDQCRAKSTYSKTTPMWCRNTTCEGHCCADVVLVIDRSGSVQDNEFVLEKNFAINLINYIKSICPTSQFGIVSFSTTAKIEGSFTNAAGAIADVNGIASPSGYTNTPDGIRKAIDIFETDKNRQDCADIMIVITDGTTNREVNQLSVEADRAANEGIAVVPVGITSNITTAELETIASHDDYIFTADNFGDLLPRVKNLMHPILCHLAHGEKWYHAEYHYNCVQDCECVPYY